MIPPDRYPKRFGAAAACLLGGSVLAACGSQPASGETLPTGAYVTYQNDHTNLAMCFQRQDDSVVTIDMNALEGLRGGRLYLGVHPELVQESLPGGDIDRPFGSRQPIGSVALVGQIQQGELRPYPHRIYHNSMTTIPCQATARLQPPPGFADNIAVVNRSIGQSLPGALLAPAKGAWENGDPQYPSPAQVFLISSLASALKNEDVATMPL